MHSCLLVGKEGSCNTDHFVLPPEAYVPIMWFASGSQSILIWMRDLLLIWMDSRWTADHVDAMNLMNRCASFVEHLV